MKLIIIALICIIAFAVFRFSKRKSDKESVQPPTEDTPEDTDQNKEKSDSEKD